MRALLVALVLVTAAAPQTRADVDLTTPQSKLSDARIAAAHKAFEAVYARWQSGTARLDDVYLWSTRILDDELHPEPMNGADPDRSHDEHLQRMKVLEAAVLVRQKHGLASAADVAAAAYYRADAEFLRENTRIE